MPRRSSRQLWAEKIRQGKASSTMGSRMILKTATPFLGKILGIDPSLRGTGLAIVQVSEGWKLSLLHSQTLRLKTTFSQTQCLGRISSAVKEILEAYTPELVAIEETIYVQNFQTAQILGAARGAAIGMAAGQGFPVFEYSPLRIKQAVVGYGRASKEQVAAQMKGLLKLDEVLGFDESDAAAVAYCHAIMSGRPQMVEQGTSS